MPDADRLQELVAEVAAAYFTNSHVPPAEIPAVVQQIASSLAAVKSAPVAEIAAEADRLPAPKRMQGAQVKKSITPEVLISFEDGKPYKTLRRHLTTRGLTPEQYREKWGLPADYPMVSPNYSATRAAMAKRAGLGQLRQRGETDPPALAEPPADGPRRGGGRKSSPASG